MLWKNIKTDCIKNRNKNTDERTGKDERRNGHNKK
jgi:hypothetical protein